MRTPSMRITTSSDWSMPSSEPSQRRSLKPVSAPGPPSARDERPWCSTPRAGAEPRAARRSPAPRPGRPAPWRAPSARRGSRDRGRRPRSPARSASRRRRGGRPRPCVAATEEASPHGRQRDEAGRARWRRGAALGARDRRGPTVAGRPAEDGGAGEEARRRDRGPGSVSSAPMMGSDRSRARPRGGGDHGDHALRARRQGEPRAPRRGRGG